MSLYALHWKQEERSPYKKFYWKDNSKEVNQSQKVSSKWLPLLDNSEDHLATFLWSSLYLFHLKLSEKLSKWNVKENYTYYNRGNWTTEGIFIACHTNWTFPSRPISFQHGLNPVNKKMQQNYNCGVPCATRLLILFIQWYRKLYLGNKPCQLS